MKGNKTELSFICIGFQKCGTTSLYDLLKQHPDIYLTEDVKEPMFYRVPFVRQILGRNWYRKRYFGHLEEARRMTPEARRLALLVLVLLPQKPAGWPLRNRSSRLPLRRSQTAPPDARAVIHPHSIPEKSMRALALAAAPVCWGKIFLQIQS